MLVYPGGNYWRFILEFPHAHQPRLPHQPHHFRLGFAKVQDQIENIPVPKDSPHYSHYRQAVFEDFGRDVMRFWKEHGTGSVDDLK